MVSNKTNPGAILKKEFHTINLSRIGQWRNLRRWRWRMMSNPVEADNVVTLSELEHTPASKPSAASHQETAPLTITAGNTLRVLTDCFGAKAMHRGPSSNSDKRRSGDRDRRRSSDRDGRRNEDYDSRRSSDRDRRRNEYYDCGRSNDHNRRRSSDRDRRRSSDRERRRNEGYDSRRSSDRNRRRSKVYDSRSSNDHDRRRSSDCDRRISSNDGNRHRYRNPVSQSGLRREFPNGNRGEYHRTVINKYYNFN